MQNLIQYLSKFSTKELYMKLEKYYLKHPVLIDENFKILKLKLINIVIFKQFCFWVEE